MVERKNMGKSVLRFFILVGLLYGLLPFVLAACSSNLDCEPTEECDGGVCTDVGYCTEGNAECSDGVDNDGNSDADYYGVCILEGSDASDVTYYVCGCYNEVNGVFTQYGSYNDLTCETDETYGCATEGNFVPDPCEPIEGVDYILGTYYPPDTECRSPLDTDEESDPECADGDDNDGNGDTDYPEDTDCASPESTSETAVSFGAPAFGAPALAPEQITGVATILSIIAVVLVIIAIASYLYLRKKGAR